MQDEEEEDDDDNDDEDDYDNWILYFHSSNIWYLPLQNKLIDSIWIKYCCKVFNKHEKNTLFDAMNLNE